MRRTRRAALAAGVLWAAQALTWTLGPKVQASEPPFAVIDRPWFTVVWCAVIGAVACSAVAVLGLLQQERTLVGRISGPARAAGLAAWSVLLLSGVAGAAVVVAALGVAGDLGVAALSPVLNVSGLLLLAALCAAAVALRGSGVLPGRWAALPTALAVLTLLTLGAIAASGSAATIGLVLAVVVVTAHGATWVLLARTQRPR
ncbi:hypothetical protein ACQPX6_01865 [Actinomycetospora sp. CA-101289]|uniref:hypothetical protein n=1 Tax=Actinomycetospora sp. CA-101289 TaxID=3239893 RepID=UPI003D962003